MATLIENLIDVLSYQYECYKVELEISNLKKEIIIANDVESLFKINQKEQELATKIFRLEQEREEYTKDIAMVINHKHEDITLTDLINLLNDTDKEKGRLIELRDKIQKIITEVKTSNDENKKLINHALEYIDFTVNAIQSVNSMPETNNYESLGKTKTTIQQKRYFDAKQ